MNLYLKDTRTPCKYGEKCYQKNPQHHKRFKHPPKSKEEEEEENTEIVSGSSPPPKKLKIDSEKKSSDVLDANLDEDGETSLIVDEDAHNDDDDDDILPSSPQSFPENIKQKFLVNMPKDFYDFWTFCEGLNKEHPEEALCKFGLRLVGAFDILSGKLRETQTRKSSRYLCHWRFYYDPPEFQTVIVGDKDEFHIGYFRDDPSEDPVFLASMIASKHGTVTLLKEDLVSSIYFYIKDSWKGDNTEKTSFLKAVKSFAKENNYNLDSVSERFKSRRKKVVSKSFHGAGIVVPVDKQTDVGYREIPETNANLRKIMKNVADASTKEKKVQALEVLQELMLNTQWATDEGDFGMGLELGINLFNYGCKDFHPFIVHLLTVAYDLLDRKPFVEIIKAHLKNRRKGSNMSAFEVEEKKS